MSNNALIAEEDLTLKCIVLTPGKKEEKTLGNALYNGLIKFLSVKYHVLPNRKRRAFVRGFALGLVMGGAVFLMFDHYDVAKEVNYYRSGDVEDAITTICRALRIATKSKITYPRSIEEFEFTTEDHMILFIKHLFEELSEKQAYKLGLHRLMWTRYTKKELLVAQE